MTRPTFPAGCHIAEVDVDPETGVVEIVKFTATDDFGTLINPLIVEGQVHGGIGQGVGQAMLEQVVYDEDGQLRPGHTWTVRRALMIWSALMLSIIQCQAHRTHWV